MMLREKRWIEALAENQNLAFDKMVETILRKKAADRFRQKRGRQVG